ncbi:MAG: amidohydrolase family protein [Peptococcaceae bacterium]|jgi:predicted TIM-barrel fold metal-dependent hydrolase|nr:amidohydrolase family protein [Peptococcaceae bacterium]
MTTPVIDFHVHPIDYESYGQATLEWIRDLQGEANWERMQKYADPDAFCSLLAENGVDYAVVLAELSPAASGTCSNEYVAAFCAGREKLIPFCTVNPHLVPDGRTELRRLVQTHGFRGLKLYPTYNHFYPNAPLLYPLYAAAEELGLPVMLHTGSSVFRGSRLKYGDPLFLDDVAVDFPRLRILLVHGGRGVWYDRAFLLTRLHENVYLEIAGLPPPKLLTYFPELDRVADKVIFGSDWPGLLDVAGNIKRIRALPLAEEVKEKILGGNAARLLGIEEK